MLRNSTLRSVFKTGCRSTFKTFIRPTPLLRTFAISPISLADTLTTTIRQIRNATQIVDFAGTKFLIDPMLSEKGAWPGFAATANSHMRNPLVDLPIALDEILDVDHIIVTHLHEDHWDEASARLIPKDKHIYTQNETDRKILQSQGFTNLEILTSDTKIGDITLTRTKTQHGSDELYADPIIGPWIGDVMGIVFRHPAAKTVYFAGDSIWTPLIAATLQRYQPSIVVLNTGWAHTLQYGSIIFGPEDLLRTHNVLPEAQIVGTHMGAINHMMCNREQLLEYARVLELGDFVSAPADGEIVTFT